MDQKLREQIHRIIKLAENTELDIGPPCIESFSESITMPNKYPETLFDYHDCKAFEGNFVEEIDGIDEMYKIYKEGKKLVRTIYCHRSVSRAFPEISNKEDETKKREILLQIYQILYPKIKIMNELRNFCFRAYKGFISNMSKFLDLSKGVLSELHKFYLILIIDVIACLDSLKAMRTSFSMDFSRFKRTSTLLGDDVPKRDEDFGPEVYDILTTQLAQPNSISQDFHIELHKISNFENSLIILMNFAAEAIEQRKFILPDHYYMYHRSILQLIYLCDDLSPLELSMFKQTEKNPPKPFNIFNNKKIKLNARIRRIVQHYPVIPLYAEMKMDAEFCLSKCVNFDREKMLPEQVQTEKRAPDYALTNHKQKIRNQYTNYSFKFAALTNEIQEYLNRDFVSNNQSKDSSTMSLSNHKTGSRAEHSGLNRGRRLSGSLFGRSKSSSHTMTDEFGLNASSKVRSLAQKVTDTLLEGLKFLSEWSSALQEQSVFKTGSPISDEKYKELVKKEEEKRFQGFAEIQKDFKENTKNLLKGSPDFYEKIVRYNYTDKELYELVDVIGMVKGLGSLLQKAEYLILPFVQIRIYEETQVFVQSKLLEPLKKAHKRKRTNVRDTMIKIREVCSDQIDLNNQPNDYLEKSSKKKSSKHGSVKDLNNQIRERSVAPSITQIYLMRRMMHSIFDESNPGMKGKFLIRDSDLKPEQLAEWKNFYGRSFYYKYLLDFKNVVGRLTDMSYMWYREFYLELTKCIQFPIEMSLPWLLTDFILKTPELITNIFFAVDIWNDSAERALCDLNQQFLFDEIEAEVNLAFDQLIFNVAKQLFDYSIDYASLLMLDKDLKQSIESKFRRSLDLENKRFRTLMDQRNIQIMGRMIDFRQLVSQHINQYLRSNINTAISYFESTDLINIIDLDLMLRQIQIAHQILSTHLNIDPFHEMFTEINQSTNLGSIRGRIFFQVLRQFGSYFFPNFTFNTTTLRFVRLRTGSSSANVSSAAGLGVGGSNADMQKRRASSAVPDEQTTSNFSVLNIRVPRAITTVFGAKFSKIFQQYLKLMKDFFGLPHVEALLRVLNRGDIPKIISECMKRAEDMTFYVLEPYIKEIMNAIEHIKPPGSQFGAIGAFTTYKLKLESISNYAPLRNEVFQIFREIGNVIAFIYILEIATQREELLDFQIQSFYCGRTPIDKLPKQKKAEVFVPSGDKRIFDQPERPTFITALKNSLQKISDVNPASVQRAESLLKWANQAHENYGSDLTNKSYITTALKKLEDSMVANGILQQQSGKYLPNGLIDVSLPLDFARVWSVIIFLFCLNTVDPDTGKSVTNLEVYGESLLWSGCTFLHILGLRNRFELMDFSYHVDFIHQSEQFNPNKSAQLETMIGAGTDVSKGANEAVQLRELLTHIKFIRNTKECIFSILESNFRPMARQIQMFDPTNYGISQVAPDQFNTTSTIIEKLKISDLN